MDNAKLIIVDYNRVPTRILLKWLNDPTWRITDQKLGELLVAEKEVHGLHRRSVIAAINARLSRHLPA
jgi:hypothetical protein